MTNLLPYQRPRLKRWTPAAIAALPAPPAGKTAEYPDPEMRRLYVRVGHGGARSFEIRYSFHSRRRRLALGPTPPLTLAAARAEARRLLEGLDLRGEDPGVSRRRAAQNALTLAELVGKYVEAGGSRRGARREPIALSTSKEYLRLAKRHLKRPPFSGPASGVTLEEIEDLLEEVAKKSGDSEANRLFQLVRATYRWARRILRCNPADGLQKPRGERSRDRVLSDQEIVALWKATAPETLDEAAAVSLSKWPRDKNREKKAERAREMRLQANACVRLQLLLGQRPNETAAMRWLDVDAFVGHGRWMNPSSVRKDRKVNVVPLGPLATRILEDLRPLTGLGERVFRDLSLRNEVRWWRPILGHAMTEGAAHFTRLDLRRTCATGCAAAGAQPYTVSRILGHAIPHGQVAITMIYDRFSRLPETAAALNAWAAHVGGLVTCSACGGAMRNEGRTLRCSACGREREQPRADVVPIARV